MALKIYLRARPVELFPTYGHASLILWDDVTNTGFTIGGNQIGVGQGPLLAYVDLPASLDEGTGPGQNPDAFDETQFDSLNTVEITGLGDVQATWDALKVHALGLDNVYDYDVVGGVANTAVPIANSNAFIYTLLNAIDVDPAPLFDAIDDDYADGLPGANLHNATLLGTSNPDGTPIELIAASEQLLNGVKLQGRDGVDDILIGTKYGDEFFGEEVLGVNDSIDTVSYERSTTGVTNAGRAHV